MVVPPSPLVPAGRSPATIEPPWITIRALPESVGVARRYARARLRAFAEEWVDTITLITSELVTNAYEAVDSAKLDEAEQVIRFGMFCTPRWTHLYVRDSAPAQPCQRDAAETDVHGRGLGIVESLAFWWVQRDGPGKTVHALVAAPDVVLTQADIDRLAVNL
ncbi:ATP-binding protein [Actinomadura sp. DC4]|uniref:ATP-binding protein n=1 Tax=Actinomadura sp. DC4 TaxID=3055069 RepID=UPI0025B00C3F|nr:ATP-binding protein [Actinomadura sp. DC4]MDN3355054.1 ATP-binding protein [Actinomadura sp. DC4]